MLGANNLESSDRLIQENRQHCFLSFVDHKIANQFFKNIMLKPEALCSIKAYQTSTCIKLVHQQSLHPSCYLFEQCCQFKNTLPQDGQSSFSMGSWHKGPCG